MAEIVRAGIISVPEGQSEAAASLGMSRMQIMRRIVLPQAMRVILPPTGNEFISMLKNTSLASTIAFAEIYFVTEDIAAVNFDVPQLLIVGSIWYLALTSVAYVGQYFLERKFGEGFSRAQQATMKERWLALVAAEAGVDERRDGQRRGRAQALRPQRGAEGHHADRQPRRGHVPARSLRVGQVDVPALHQPPREDQLRPSLGRRGARRLPRGQRQALRAA